MEKDMAMACNLVIYSLEIERLVKDDAAFPESPRRPFSQHISIELLYADSEEAAREKEEEAREKARQFMREHPKLLNRGNRYKSIGVRLVRVKYLKRTRRVLRFFKKTDYWQEKEEIPLKHVG